MTGIPFSRMRRRGWHMLDEIDLVPLMVEHGSWRRLCARLESIADALPALPTLIAIAALRSDLRGTFEQGGDDRPLQTMFDLETARPPVRHLLTRLQERRAELAVRVQDLADMMAPQLSGRMSVDTLGYMLRSIFEGYRESIELETMALLLIAPERLTAASRALLLQRLAESDG